MNEQSHASPPERAGHPATVQLLLDRRGLLGYLAADPHRESDSAGTSWITLADLPANSTVLEESGWELANRLDLPLLAAPDFEPDPDALAEIAPAAARRLRAVPLLVDRGRIAVALEAPDDRDTLTQLNFLTRHVVMPVVASAHLIREAIAHHYDRTEDLAMVSALGLDPHAEGSTPASDREVERLAREQPVVRMVSELIEGAVRRRASDIHVRPGEHGADILYRIDDEMVPVRRVMRALQPALVSRIKVLAAMNLAEHRKPQDGRCTFALDDGHRVDVRVSVLPAVHGESVVVRLLDSAESLWNLEQLGLSPEDRRRVDDVMTRSHGMFLTTGPTGCGKSTTLYAMLLELRKQRVNILTIEDPVEFYIEDVQQMQVNRPAEFTFASAMRNFLRHDPDVIMVGEIRDRETAEIAVESALTGHLVLSTLHTNTAATTVTRLLDLGVEPFLLRASLLAVMSQRLVRLTCAHCREVEPVDAHMRERLGVGPEEVFYFGRGCARCEGLGVHKRQAVYELFVVTPAIQKLIGPGAEADAIHRVAVEEGMVTLTAAAVQMAREGHISLAEAWRVRAD
jgi:type IV pilus assembly protein PilB